MYNPSINSLEQVVPTTHDSFVARMFMRIRENVTVANSVGLLGGILALFCLLVLPSSNYWNIRLPLYLILVIWTFLRPRVALYLLPIAIPWGSLDTISIGKLNVSSTDILVILLIASWLGSFVLRSQGLKHSGPLDQEQHPLPRYLVVAGVALLFAMMLSAATAHSVNASIKELIKWIEFLAVLILGAKYLRTRNQIWTLIILMCLAGISQAFYGYAQNFLSLGPQSFIRDGGLRVYGTFNQPNPYAGYINMSLPIALSLTVLGRNWATRILAGTAAILLGAAEYLTKSNGGEIAIAVAVLFIFIVGFPQLRKLAAVGVVGGLTLVAALIAGVVPQRFTLPILSKLGLIAISFKSPSPQDFSTAERLAHWIAGIRMFMDHPLTGVGIGNYGDAYPPYHVTIFINSLDHAHNYYINISAETGIIGLIAFVLLLIASFVAGGRAYRTISKKYMQIKAKRATPQIRQSRLEVLHSCNMLGVFTNDRALAIGLIAALLSVCVHNLVDDLYVHGMTILFALLLAALIRIAGVHSETVSTGGLHTSC
ncbi:MAG: hypothetical protein NVSMB38_16590 [Ktedonobacteraceae bacterium]